MWIFKKWCVLPHYSHLFQKSTHARLPKNVYQLNELSGGISGLDSEHGTPTQMREVFGLIPKYLNKVAKHLSHFSSEFHKILGTYHFFYVWGGCNFPAEIVSKIFFPPAEYT